MRRIGAGIQILSEQLLPLQVGLNAGLQDGELLRREPVVDPAPPHLAGDRWLIDDKLILRRSTGVLTGLDDQGPIHRQLPFVPTHRLGDQGWCRRVPMHGP